METKNWRNDWHVFIGDVSSDINNGLSERALSAKYSNQPVEWTGAVIEVRLDDAPCVKVLMPPVEVRIHGRRAGVADYIALNIDRAQVEKWDPARPDVRIRFRTTIPERNAIFPGLEWVQLS